MQTIGQFDEYDAHIARHGQQHFAKILGLRFFQRGELQFIEFRYAVDQFGHGFAELLGDIGLGGRCIFHHIMQDGSD